jgi:FdhD protein
MKTVLISGARASVGKTWLARILCDLVPGSVCIKVSHGARTTAGGDFCYAAETPFESIVREHSAASWLVIEGDGVLEHITPDCTIYLEGGNPQLSVPRARDKADIIRGTRMAPENVKRLSARLDCGPSLVRQLAWLAGARPSPVTGLILAGGKSSRMGVDKAFLHLGDATAIDVLHSQLSSWCDQISVVTSRDRLEHYRGYSVIPDEVSDQGPFMGLCSGLAASSTDVNIVVACDIPLIEPCLLARMLSQSEDSDIVIASLPASRGDQPLLGVYKRSVLPAARKLLAAGHRRVAELFPLCKTERVVSEDDCWYTNLNTPREYHRFVERDNTLRVVSGDTLAAGDDFDSSVDVNVVRSRRGVAAEAKQPVATEIPCTIIGNGVEVATLLCSPSDLKELAVGFLYASAFINTIDDIRTATVDTTRWVVACELTRTPAPDLMTRRMYTPGCGRGVMYSSLSETGVRQPLISPERLAPSQIAGLARWLQQCSSLFRSTGGVHSAAISDRGALPQTCIDDIARHCAVDKVIGRWLLEGRRFEGTVLVCSGRISSEILHKARRAGIAMVISRGGPTHQAVLRARELGITLIGFARGEDFTVYAHPDRVDFAAP